MRVLTATKTQIKSNICLLWIHTWQRAWSHPSVRNVVWLQTIRSLKSTTAWVLRYPNDTDSDGSLRLEGTRAMEPKIYGAVVQPVGMYGVGCYLVNNETGRLLDVAKEKMLRQKVWGKPLDRVRNDSVRQKFGVALILRSCAKLDSDGTVRPSLKRCHLEGGWRLSLDMSRKKD